MKTRISKSMLGVIAGIGLVASPSLAGANSVSYQCGTLPAVVVADGAAGDLDPAVNHIQVSISCNVIVGMNHWTASGNLYGDVDPVLSTAKTRTAVLIQSLAGKIVGQTFKVEHDFSPPFIGNRNTTSNLGGVFTHLPAGPVSGASLDYSANVIGTLGTTLVGSGSTGHVGGAAPIPFNWAAGPVVSYAPYKHQGNLTFYLDMPGDAAAVGTAVPWTIETK